MTANLETLRDALPDYAKDLRLNLGSVLADVPGMTKSQQWGTALAVAIATRNAQVQQAIAAEAATRLSPEEQTAARIAAAIMAMNNVYYRSLHLLEDESYLKSPAGLRMNAMAQHQASKVDFELWALAVSAVNGCGMCIQSHQKKLVAEGVSDDIIRAAFRIAAVLQAVAVTLEAEAAIPSGTNLAAVA
jgi:alkyl hydroperoxide reductase subunit D